MTLEADFGRLTRVGVSPEGVDFVRKMLVREPLERATDNQCLRHPWIADLSNSDNGDVDMEPDLDLPMIEEDEEDEELDASQLNLNGNPEVDDSDYEGASDIDELDMRQSKRARTNSPRRYRPDVPASSRDSFDTIPLMLGPLSNPSANGAPPRLFGEIGTSALQSSGALGQDAHAALDMVAEGSLDEDISVSDASAIGFSRESHVTSDDIAQHPLQYPQTLPGPAPSLLGTEALVDQLKMASPESGLSTPSVDSKSRTPRTPRSPELSPSASATAGVKRSSQEVQADLELTPSKRAKPPSPATPLKPKSPAKPRPNTDNANTAQHASGIDTDALASYMSQQQEAAINNGLEGEALASHMTRSQEEALRILQRDTIAGAQEPMEHKRQQSSKPSKEKATARTTSRATAGQQDDPAANSQTHQDSRSSSGSNSASTSTIAPGPTATSFPVPAPILGRLNTVKGSVIDTSHYNLTKRITYYGRVEEKHDPSSSTPFTSYVYPHNMDARVPKNALDIMFWRPGIEEDEKEGKDWVKKDDFWAILMTRTSGQVWVNGVKLIKGQGYVHSPHPPFLLSSTANAYSPNRCALYGKLHTGDIITVFGPAFGTHPTSNPAPAASTTKGPQGTSPAPKPPRSQEYLRFECEFFAGKSKARRTADSPPFIIESEVTKYQEMQARRSRGASMRSEGGDTSAAES